MTTKAAHYIEQLDQARCDGNWSAVPELVRKVRKHAPERACLTLTAETECAISSVTGAASIANAASTAGTHASPPTAALSPNTAAATNLNVSSKLPQLMTAIEEEHQFAEDRFQAQVCVGWLHWVVAEYSLALSRLPKGLDQHDSQLDLSETSSEWTNVCALKSAYLRANCLTRNYQRPDALVAFNAGLPALERVWSNPAARKQLRYWAELFLTEFCMLASQSIREGESSLKDPNSLACFRSWAKFWHSSSSSVVGGYGFKGSVPRRRIYNEYYIAVSRILEDDLPFPTGYVEKITNEVSARHRLRAELKHVEAAYQALLLAETTFPRADEERAEVEIFAKLVVKNWSILCGRGWREQDLGPGGRNSLSRGVLETLYAAATKTYHSTAILRSLFTLHLSVAEFELAFRAFDSYIEIVKKGKARVDKTGHLEASLDDDGTVLETISQCVIALCQYGHQEAAEKARSLGAELEDWLSKLPQIKQTENGTPLIAEQEEKSELHPPVPPHVLALAWQAIGLSHAQWSRVTFEAASRTEVQSRAIRCLRRSLASEFGRSKDINSFFALALLLAERRELTAAIETVRAALMTSSSQDANYHLMYGPHWQKRSLIPMWHLLALLLSARQDYVAASRACEGALEQFKDPAVLFGKGDTTFRSEHLNEADAKGPSESHHGLVDDMDDAEKESILEVKMTQLALVELLEGPEVAVNASYELLTLFSRLFGNVAAQPVLNPPKLVEPPKTSGTLRSIRGSIFGHKDRSRPPTRQASTATISEESETLPVRPATAQTSVSRAPTIHVTEENSQGGGLAPSRQSGSVRTQRSDSKRRNSLRKRDRSASRGRPSTGSAISKHEPVVVDGETFYTPAVDAEQSDFFTFTSKRQPHRAPSFTRDKTLTSLSSYLSSNSKSTDYSELAAETTYANTNLLPLIQFSKDKERAHRTAILINVWLMIAGFYRRADMLADSKGAAAEAQKLVQGMENESTREAAGSSGPKAAGWAEKKSIEQLWADVWAEHGLLSLAKKAPYDARADFETALTHSPDHPAATVGLSNILLDIYSEDLLPIPAIPPLDNSEASSDVPSKVAALRSAKDGPQPLPNSPLGLGPSLSARPSAVDNQTTSSLADDQLPAPYKATSLPLVDRLAARDRAYALLTSLTRLGSGWNYSEAWFALARAYEQSGQQDKAKEVLWWCVELEEAMGVRDWRCLGSGGYTI